MKKEIIISEANDLAVVLEDGRAVEFFLRHGDQLVGDILWGQVEAVVPGIEAAFVNIGQDRNGFIHVADLPDAQTPRRQGPPKRPTIKVKDRILVQIAKAPTGNKGARLTGRMTIPGRFFVLVPHDNRVSISRRITDGTERDRLRRLTLKLKDPGHGLIVRTEATDRSEEDLRQDIEELIDIWADILHQVQIMDPPALLHRDSDLIHRVLRDAVTADVSKIVVDSAAGYDKACEILEGWMPDLVPHVTQHKGRENVLDRYRVRGELEAAISPKVWMPSGGYLVIEHTEALTVIDVNSGRSTQSRSLADTVLRTNMEAANEVARQLRLRDIGGIIVIDFISMDHQGDRNKVLQAFHEALRTDKSRPQVTNFSEHGLIEVSRRRQGQNLLEQLTIPCPACEGLGRQRNSELLPTEVSHPARPTYMQVEDSAIVHEITEEPLASEIILDDGTVLASDDEDSEEGDKANGRRRRRRRGRGRTAAGQMDTSLSASGQADDEEAFSPPALPEARPAARDRDRGRPAPTRTEPAVASFEPMDLLAEEVTLEGLFVPSGPSSVPPSRERGRGNSRPFNDRNAGERAPRERGPQEPFDAPTPRSTSNSAPLEPYVPQEFSVSTPAPRTRRVEAASTTKTAAPSRPAPQRQVAPKAEVAPAPVARVAVKTAAPIADAALPVATPTRAAAVPKAPVKKAAPAAEKPVSKPLPIPEELAVTSVPGVFVLKKKLKTPEAEAPVAQEATPIEAAEKKAVRKRAVAAKPIALEAPEAALEAPVKPKAKAKPKAEVAPAEAPAPKAKAPAKRVAKPKAIKE